MAYKVTAPKGSIGFAQPDAKSKRIHTVPFGYQPLERKGVDRTGDWVKLGGYGTVSWHRVNELAWLPKAVTQSRPKLMADLFLAYVLAAWFDNPDRLHDYIWGAEGGNDDHSKSGDPEWDCSGLFYAALRYAGYKIGRMTANDYFHVMKPIGMPTQVGDVAYRFSGGRAVHIVIYTGDGYFIEARGKDYGIERHKVSTAGARGLKWYRSDKINAALKQAA